jgi:thermitase
MRGPRVRWLAIFLALATLVASWPFATAPVQAQTGPVPVPANARGGGDTARTRNVTIQARGQSIQTRTFEQETAPNGEPMRAGGLLVKFRAGAASATREGAHRAAAAQSVQSLSQPDLAQVTVTPSQTEAALRAYRGQSAVEWAQPDYIRHTTATPNDPNFPSQWGLSRINAPAAWNVTHGSSNVKLAILDCGIYTESSTYVAPDGKTGHPDLRGKVVAEQDFTGSASGPDDLCDHGTHVAGIAAANTANGIGGAGIGYNTALLNGKVLDDSGSGSDQDIAEGIDWAVSKGAKVISMSLGGGGTCDDSPVVKTAIAKAWTAGIVVVAAAGNNADGASLFPANCPNVVSVAATDQSDARASFSNYGINVDVAAPGLNILSSDYLGTYETLSGTSMATPFVSGLMALVWTTSYGTSAQAVIDRVLSTAATRSSSDSLGSIKRIDAAAAVGDGSTPLPPSEPAISQPDLSVTLSSSANSVKVKSTVTYTSVITNNGSKSATGVTLTDKLPGNVDLQSYKTTLGSCKKSSATVTCTVGSLPIGQSATVTIVAKLNKVGSVANSVSVALAEKDTTPANNTASAAVTVTK